jgi:PadR family transcriptional regulator, regulatory protein PadR
MQSELKTELKKGTAEVLILSLLEHQPRHGYEIAKLIEQRSGGILEFHVASLYPMLYRMERRGWIEGRWLEKAGQRRRRFYKLTSAGRRALPEQRKTWREFIRAVQRIAQVEQG